MRDHNTALRKLLEVGHKDTAEYVQTLEAHNKLLQDELDLVLTLFVKQVLANQRVEFSEAIEKAEAVLKYTREYLNRQY